MKTIPSRTIKSAFIVAEAKALLLWVSPKEVETDIIDRHFAAENAHDVEATLATYTDDIVWDDITHPDAPFHGKEEVGRVYSSIIDAIPDVVLESVRRFAGEDGRYVVDESLLTGHVHGEWSGMKGGGAPVEVRILHIFELRDGLICYENAWFDASAVQRQILAYGADSEGNRGGIATTQTFGLGSGPILDP